MVARGRLLVLGLVFCLSSWGFAQEKKAPAPPLQLTEKTWKTWLDFIRPKPEDLRWENIPWRLSLTEALGEAQKDQKPIFLWVMQGHPLGCT
jgi:hypothetical protein